MKKHVARAGKRVVQALDAGAAVENAAVGELYAHVRRVLREQRRDVLVALSEERMHIGGLQLLDRRHVFQVPHARLEFLLEPR